MKKIISSIFLAVALIVSSAAAQTYERADLWQKEIDQFVEIDRRQTPPDDAVLFVGSSSFRMWQSLRADFPGARIINRGFGGSHFEDAIHYARQIIAPYRAKTVFIYEGDNDITSGKSVERVFNDYRTLVRLIHESSPKARVVFVSIKPSPARREFWSKFQQLNALVKAETAKDKRLLYADIWTPMLTERGEPREELYVADRVHMKPEGYAIWRAVLAKYIK